MPPLKKARLPFQLIWLLLFPIPLLWCVLSHYGKLEFIENRTIDARFRYRGELSSPVHIVYVDVDSLSLSEIGGWPWNRSYFAELSQALLKEAHVKAIGFDFVFSDLGVAESVDLRKYVQGNLKFGGFLAPFDRPVPPVALAAAYAGYKSTDINGEEFEREIPLLRNGPPSERALRGPEMPAFRRSLNEKVFTYPPIVGLIDTIDNGTRAVPAWVPVGRDGSRFFHLGFQLARLYWGLPPAGLKVNGDHVEFRKADGTLQAAVPLRDGQLFDLNWFTAWRSPQVEHFSFSTMHQLALAATEGDADEKKIAADFFAEHGFRDAVVLIGPTDPLFQDLGPTPLDDRMQPKVGVHANVLKTIVSGKYLHLPPRWHGLAWLEFALVFALTTLVTALAVSSGSRSWHGAALKGAAIVLAIGYVVIAFEVFKRGHLVLPLTAPLGAAFTTSFAGLIWQVVQEQKAKGRIKGMFGTYLAPTVVERMIESGEDPELGGHDAEITAYFSDIQKFSSFSEVMPSARLTELLNEYLSECTDIVQAEMGTLDKYIGDAVVAMFGAPLEAADHAYRACVASQLVQLRIAELRQKWRREGDKWPVLVHNLRTRIGLNTGVCMIGNMGSRTRFNYTMMGDNVNLAARMESGAKSWGVYTMCTEATRTGCLGRGDRVVFRKLAQLEVQGRSQAVQVYEIVGLKENVTDRTHECIALFEQALERYYARDWEAASSLLRRSAELEPNQPGEGISTNLSTVYLKIVKETQARPPPPNWDGRYVMTEK
jgi:adenylate cyclase